MGYNTRASRRGDHNPHHSLYGRGRLVIPKEMRLKFHLEREVEILPTDEGILIRNPKYRIIEIESVKETNLKKADASK